MNNKSHISFGGDFSELQSELQDAGIAGVWRKIPHGHEFRTEDGGVMAFYHRRGNLLFQGEILSLLELQRSVEAHAELALNRGFEVGWRSTREAEV